MSSKSTLRQPQCGVGGQRDGQSGMLGSPGPVIGEKGCPAQGKWEKLMDGGHPILVRTSPSDRNLSVKLLKYFGSRSKSGGGECDVTRVDGQTYCAIFQKQDDQRRVLERGNHVIEFTVFVSVHDIGREDLGRIRQMSSDEERLKVLQQLAVSAENSVSCLPDDQAAQLCLTSALYEYIVEIYRTDMDRLERSYGVKIDHRSTPEGSTYVRFIPQGSGSLPEDAKEKFTDKVQKVTDDWSQVTVDRSVVSMSFSDIRERVKAHWTKILVKQEENMDIVLRGPRDELPQVMKFLEKADLEPARPRRAVTISTGDLKMENQVDPRHMDILKKLKPTEISDIEKKYNVKMEERRINGSSLVTFRTMNAPPDLSPHASHSFITLLQKTFFNIEKKQINMKPHIQEERVSLVQEELIEAGIDIVMECSRGTVLLIGDPVDVRFAEERLSGM